MHSGDFPHVACDIVVEYRVMDRKMKILYHLNEYE
jgi:hypothetical protein